MEFRFKNQRYKEDAATAVVSVFQGQPKQDAFTYLRDKGQKVLRKGMESLFSLGEVGSGVTLGFNDYSLLSFVVLR
jgi:hypothetical protein